MKEASTDKWFGPLAHAIVVSGIVAVTFYMVQGVGHGTFPWWPYPAFTATVALMFTAYGFLRRS